MIRSFITKTRWLVTIILLTSLSIGQMWGETFNIVASNFGGSYSDTEATFTAGGSYTIGYKNIIKNANGTPSGWATNQIIQMKKNASACGQLYNKTSIQGLSKIRFWIQSGTTFEIYTGSSMITSSPASGALTLGSAAGSETVSYTTYAKGGATSSSTISLNYYDINITNGDTYFYITTKNIVTAYIFKIEITYSSGTSVSLSKAATSNGSFVLSSSNTGTPEINSVSTAGGTGTVYVKGTPNTGYYVSSVTQSGASAAPTITEVSENNWTVVYGSGTTGASTITVTFSPIWALKGDFDSWGDGYVMTGTGTVSVTRTLTANTRYEFKIYNKATAYGNNGAIVGPMSGWTMETDKGNCRIHTANAGSYTFSINTSTKALSVTYPDVTHPSEYYVYFKNSDVWGTVYGFMTGGSGDFAGWPGTVTNTTTICGETYHYAALLDNGSVYNKIIFNNGGTGYGNQTRDLTMPGAGKYNANRDANWHTFDKYTISYDKGTGSGATMASETDICPGGEQALSANTYTKDHYHFTGWIADRDVTINSATVTQGTLITGTPTIENIQHHIALTAQWEADSYTVTATLTNLTPNSAFPSSFTYTGSSTTALNRTLSAATGYNLPTSITVTMGGSTLTKDTHYTYNSTNGAFTFTATITGAIVITAAGVAKTYSNTLDLEGAGSGSTTVTTTYNSSTLTGYTAPTKTGYIFGGYWSADNGTGTEVIGTNGALKTSVTIDAVAWTDGSGNWVKDGAVTLYAKWTPITYTVAFDKNHASATGTMSNQTSFSYGVGKTLSKCTFTAPTHKYFYGWHRTKAQADAGNREYTDEQSVTDLTTTDGATVTLYAVWKDHTYENYRTSCADQYNIVLDDGLVATTNNGSAKVADKGTKLTSIVAPTKSGYDVEGYYTTSGLTTKIATVDGDLQNGSGSGITVGGNAWTNSSSQWVLEAGETFYTKWTAHEYDITYEGLEGASNTNPAKYTIETATIVLANPGSRTGYTFSGWTLGGSPITQITVGSTGDKTITANWTINTPNLAVSAADHVVITATPASESAIAEGANRNVNYNKTITLNCTPDSHWNLEWDVYKTGESSTKVALTGSGDGATFTMPDYAVTVTAVMSEDTYHTATFKNNNRIIDGYDGVKTYDGTKPSAPTLTDVTDACDKTDCNKFYGWIAEDAIWSKTINSVAGKTIYRHAEDIPVVSGADVVYHAVWAKGSGDPDIPNTLIAKWDKQSIAASTAIKAKDKDGNTLNSVTLTSNIAMTTDAVYGYANTSISTDPVITIAGLDFSDYDAGVITFFARGSQQAIITVDYSTDNGSSYSTDHFTDGTAKKELGYVVTVPNTTTNVKISYGSNTGNFYFGTVRAYGTQTTSYDFAELTSSNTSGWSGADWDGYYLIVGNSNTKAFRSDIMEGLYGMTTVSPSEGVISTSDLGLMFKAKYNSSTTGYAIRSAATQDYLTDNGGGVSEKYHLLETSATEAISIAYNQITHATGYYVQWATDRFGSYGSSTAPTLYKIMTTFTEFRVTCCDKGVTIGTPSKTGSGAVTFASGGDAYAAGDKVETCEGETTITATVTPTNGYQCTALGFSGGSVSVSPAIPEPFVPYTAATAYTLTFDQNTNATLATTVTFTALVDHYIDNMHYNTTQNKSGNYGTAPSLSNETKGEECTGLHYKFVGWIPESDMNMTTGVPTTTANMVAGGATGKYATGTNYYAIWAEEE